MTISGCVQKAVLACLLDEGQLNVLQLAQQTSRSENMIYNCVKDLSAHGLTTYGEQQKAKCPLTQRRRKICGLSMHGIERALEIERAAQAGDQPYEMA